MIEKIFVIVLCFACILLLIAFALLIIKYAILRPIANFYIKNNSNKIQWKCLETQLAKEYRLNGKTLIEFDLFYRVLPSELSNFTKFFGDNSWNYFSQEEPFKFKSETEFKQYVSKFKTLGDIEKYYKDLDNNIVWYEP